MVKIIIIHITIQYFIFLFTIKDKSVRLLERTRAYTRLSIAVVKLTFMFVAYGSGSQTFCVATTLEKFAGLAAYQQ